MSDFRCPNYWWDGSQWRCQNIPNDYLSVHDFDTYCTNKSRCLECPYMDSDVRERVAAWKKENEERKEERIEELEQEAKKENTKNVTDYTTTHESTATTRTTSYSPSDDSDSGCLGAVSTLLWGLISFVFVVSIPFLFVYYIIPFGLGVSWIGILSMLLSVLFANFGLIYIAFVSAVPCVLIMCAFYPYYIISVIIKIKTKCSRKEFLKLFWKWFLKGPIAYVDLVDLLNKTNTLPRVARFYSKRIEFFKKLFNKKQNH